MASVKVSKPKSLPAPVDRAQFVLGSRPKTVRTPLNIKPGTGDGRMYAKGNLPDPAGASAGNTGTLM